MLPPSTQRGSVQGELAGRVLIQDPSSLVQPGQIYSSGTEEGEQQAHGVRQGWGYL